MLTDGDVIVVGKHRLTFSAGSNELHAVDWRGGQRSGEDGDSGPDAASDSSGITFGPFNEGK
jgi:hypothetical protein